MPVTLKDIAAAVGVSIPTVSIVLNNKPKRTWVSKETQERIFETARRLGYQPNSSAKALATRRTKTIGLLLSGDITAGWGNPYFGDVLTAAETTCHSRGYSLHAHRYDLNDLKTVVLPPMVSQGSVDGILITGHVEAKAMVLFRQARMPCVFLGDNHEIAATAPVICHGFTATIVDIARHAVSLGHRRMALLMPTDKRARSKLAALRASLRSHEETLNCRLELLGCPGRMDHTGAPQLFETWRGQPATRRARLLIGNPMLLMGILQQLAEHGLACPRDVSLVADADGLLSQLAQPRLTAVDQDLAGLTRQAFNLLIDHLERAGGELPKPQHIACPGRLVIRHSVGRYEAT